MLVEPDLTEAMVDLPEGTYTCRIVDTKSGAWRTGTKYQEWKLETFGAENTVHNNRMIQHRTPTHGKGSTFLKKFYKAVVGEELTGTFDTDQLLGKELRVAIIPGKDQNGELTGFSEVKNVLPI